MSLSQTWLTESSLGPPGEFGGQCTPGSQVETAAKGSLGSSPSMVLLMSYPSSGYQSTFSKGTKKAEGKVPRKDQEEAMLCGEGELRKQQGASEIRSPKGTWPEDTQDAEEGGRVKPIAGTELGREGQVRGLP